MSYFIRLCRADDAPTASRQQAFLKKAPVRGIFTGTDEGHAYGWEYENNLLLSMNQNSLDLPSHVPLDGKNHHLWAGKKKGGRKRKNKKKRKKKKERKKKKRKER